MKSDLRVKQQLADSLGGMANDYWNSLLDYFNNNLTKQQLDGVLIYLTPEQQHLHNKLLYSIINNSQSDLVTEEEELVFKSTQRNNYRHFQQRFNTKIIQSLSKEHLKHLSTIQQAGEEEEEIYKEFDDPKGIDGIPFNSLKDLPCLDQLYSKVAFISAFHGLEVTREVVELLNQALQNYLKNILSDCVEKNDRIDIEELIIAFQSSPYSALLESIE